MVTSQQTGIRFAKRIFGPRVLGCALCFVFIFASTYPQAQAQWIWWWMGINGFVWPWVGRIIALRSSLPYRAELRNLLLDSFFAGGWVVVMHGAILPSVLLLSMVTMNNVAAHGARFMLKGLLAEALGVVVMIGLIGWEYQPQASEVVTWACLPMLIAYPLTVGWTNYMLALRLYEQRNAFDIVNCFEERGRVADYNEWMTLLAGHFQRCRRSNGFSSLAVIRIEDFSVLQGRYGYLAAQAFTLRLSYILRSEVRALDMLGSNGRDEFYILFPNTHAVTTLTGIERIRRQFQQFGSQGAELPAVSVSVGLTEYSSGLVSESHWLDAARGALIETAGEKRNPRSLVS